MADDPMYETVWNGGPGLTTVGAQRPGAVQIDVKEGDVAQWVELQQYDATHPRRVPGIDTDSFAYVVVYDTAHVAQPAYRWAIARLAAQWSRVLQYARYGGWPYCHLCGLAMPTYAGGVFRTQRFRLCETPRHRAVCQRCYVLYRMARGNWAGVRGFARWRATRPVFTPTERAARRRARERARYQHLKATRAASAATAPASPAARTPSADPGQSPADQTARPAPPIARAP